MSGSAPDLSSTTAQKLATAKQKKDTADEAFKQGNVKDGESRFSLEGHESF